MGFIYVEILFFPRSWIFVVLIFPLFVHQMVLGGFCAEKCNFWWRFASVKSLSQPKTYYPTFSPLLDPLRDLWYWFKTTLLHHRSRRPPTPRWFPGPNPNQRRTATSYPQPRRTRKPPFTHTCHPQQPPNDVMTFDPFFNRSSAPPFCSLVFSRLPKKGEIF